MKELWIVLCFCIHSLFSFGQGGGSTSVLNDPSRNQNLHDSINKVKSLLFCSSLMGSAFILNKSKLFNIDQSIKSERDENYFKFRTKVDDYLQFAPILAGYVMGLSGDKSNLWYYTKRLFVTEAMIGILVPKLKTWSRVKNPNTDHYNAFPSGHTAQAFAAATLVSDHFCKKKPVLIGLAYGSAAAVGCLRVLNNKHWATDILAGAAFGIFTAKVSEILIKPRRGKRTHQIQE